VFRLFLAIAPEVRVMEYRTLGKSGLRVTPAWLGTANFGAQGCDAAEADRITAAFLDSGHNVVDVGGGGPQEVEFAERALRGRRDSIVLVTKALQPTPRRSVTYLSRTFLVETLDARLRGLATDHIDLLQIHSFPEDTPIEETMATLDGFVRSGKVRYVGCGNFTAAQIVEAQWAAQRLGGPPLVSLQAQYSLLARGIEPDVLPTCERHGLGVAARTPLANGVLTGRYRDGSKPEAGSRIDFYQSLDLPAIRALADDLLDGRNHRIIDELTAIAADLDSTPAAVAIAWIRQRPGITSVIIGPRLADHVDANLAGFRLDLPTDAVRRLNDLSEPAGIGPLDGAALTVPKRS
jgi:aryl-alcohol dehydrogenase-like predicted oxidoreductase